MGARTSQTDHLDPHGREEASFGSWLKKYTRYAPFLKTVSTEGILPYTSYIRSRLTRNQARLGARVDSAGKPKARCQKSRAAYESSTIASGNTAQLHVKTICIHKTFDQLLSIASHRR
jgi:hypothetical protein